MYAKITWLHIDFASMVNIMSRRYEQQTDVKIITCGRVSRYVRVSVTPINL
jgi:hypothetical protein